jgi:predicted transcriptional regulator
MQSDDPDFEPKAADVIGLYVNPPDHAAVFAVDEKTAIQALDRLDPVLPLSPGRAERHGFESQAIWLESFPVVECVRRAQIHEPERVTMSYMKTSTITIRLDDALGRELDQACAQTGRTRSELARDALRRQLALLRFERLRKRTLPLAEAQGYLTDEDVFRDVS